jgi:EPS-associated MarR family transcriptional regulator
MSRSGRKWPIAPSEALMAVLSEEVRFKLFRLLEANPRASQRELARELGISLGKVNYCLKALVQTGLIKATNFKNSRSKVAYMYLLTPRGVQEKAAVTASFLQRKIEEHEAFKEEIEAIRRQAELGARR